MQTSTLTLEALQSKLARLNKKSLELTKAYFLVFKDVGRAKFDIAKKLRLIYKEMGAIQQAIRDRQAYQNDFFMGHAPANQSAV
jgi:hypothetical protein